MVDQRKNSSMSSMLMKVGGLDLLSLGHVSMHCCHSKPWVGLNINRDFVDLK